MRLEDKIEHMLKNGYKLTLEKYLISKNNEPSYRLIKNGKKKYSEMRVMPVNYTGMMTDDKDYRYKTISFNGVSRFYLHRLIWQVFNGEIPKSMTIDHIDNNRYNNSLSNLQLMTQAENSRKGMNKSREDGVITDKKCRAVICNETGIKFEGATEAAAWLPGPMKTNRASIYKHLRGAHNDRGYKIKTIKGHTFRYADE